MKRFIPDRVLVEKAAMDHPRAGIILERLKGLELAVMEDNRATHANAGTLDDRFRQEKKALAIAMKKGGMVKEFRRHPALKQDREYYLIHSANCPFDCSYCYLQCYFENAIPTIYVNTDDMFNQVLDALQDGQNGETLFHAGETADALALEHLSGFAVEAVGFFANLDDACLELRTKSTNIEAVLPLTHARRTVMSWTLTPEGIAAEYERGTASLEERLSAASQCSRAGYPIGLRLDPLIHHRGWRQGYEELIEAVAETLDPEAIHSIVLGGFRFPPRLREIMVDRFGRNELVLGEFVPSPDGKFRYFRHIREEMYRDLIRMIRKHLGPRIESKIELAMEPAYVWANVGLTEGE